MYAYAYTCVCIIHTHTHTHTRTLSCFPPPLLSWDLVVDVLSVELSAALEREASQWTLTPFESHQREPVRVQTHQLASSLLPGAERLLLGVSMTRCVQVIPRSQVELVTLMDSLGSTLNQKDQHWRNQWTSVHPRPLALLAPWLPAPSHLSHGS